MAQETSSLGREIALAPAWVRKVFTSCSIQLQWFGLAFIPAIAGLAKNIATGHFTAVDVQRHSRLGAAGIANRVILMRRDQASRASAAGIDRTDFFESEPLALLIQFLIGNHLDAA